MVCQCVKFDARVSVNTRVGCDAHSCRRAEDDASAMADLKEKLYKKFGNAINLEE